MIYAKWICKNQIAKTKEEFMNRTNNGWSKEEFTVYCKGEISKNYNLCCVPLSHIFDYAKYGEIIAIVEMPDEYKNKKYSDLPRGSYDVKISMEQQKIVDLLPITKNTVDFILKEVGDYSILVNHNGYARYKDENHIPLSVKQYLANKLNYKLV